MSSRSRRTGTTSRARASRTAGSRARKELGQHFLVDPLALERIVAAAEVSAGGTVLEVGAGTGALTKALLAVAGGIAAVELDESLCRVLRARFADQPAVRVLNANILGYQPGELLAEAGLEPPYVVVANIPYYITAPILRHFLEAFVSPLRLVLTVQREVAESVAAPAGRMSLLGASVQFFATAEILFYLKPESFLPSPKVESAVLRIDVAPAPKIDVEDRSTFFEVIRAGFRSPRKQLHNALSQGLWLPPGVAESLLREAGIDPVRRAQTLGLEDWGRVYRAYLQGKERWRRDRAGVGRAADGDSVDLRHG